MSASGDSEATTATTATTEAEVTQTDAEAAAILKWQLTCHDQDGSGLLFGWSDELGLAADQPTHAMTKLFRGVPQWLLLIEKACLDSRGGKSVLWLVGAPGTDADTSSIRFMNQMDFELYGERRERGGVFCIVDKQRTTEDETRIAKAALAGATRQGNILAPNCVMLEDDGGYYGVAIGPKRSARVFYERYNGIISRLAVVINW